MSPLAIVLRFLGARAAKRGGATLYLTLATTGWRILRRVTATRERTLLRFEVKPGEAFEIRGVRRGR